MNLSETLTNRLLDLNTRISLSRFRFLHPGAVPWEPKLVTWSCQKHENGYYCEVAGMRIPLQLNESFSLLWLKIFIAIEKSAKGHSSLSPGKTPLTQWGQNHFEIAYQFFINPRNWHNKMFLSFKDRMRNSKISLGITFNNDMKIQNIHISEMFWYLSCPRST